uniref:Zinc finger protein 706 n=1 Tax=Calidris pygmaea TaxID=425635 RepID=A0A8C3J6W8_9CHAR
RRGPRPRGTARPELGCISGRSRAPSFILYRAPGPRPCRTLVPRGVGRDPAPQPARPPQGPGSLPAPSSAPGDGDCQPQPPGCGDRRLATGDGRGPIPWRGGVPSRSARAQARPARRRPPRPPPPALCNGRAPPLAEGTRSRAARAGQRGGWGGAAHAQCPPPRPPPPLPPPSFSSSSSRAGGGGGCCGAARSLLLPLARAAQAGSPRPDMARGQQKIQSQQKNAKKQAEQKKKQGHDQKAAAKAALIYTCTVCRTQMPDPKTFKQHFESKHPKTPLPPELADVQA